MANSSMSVAGTVTGSGTVNSGTQNDLAYYANNGTVLSALATANSAMLVTSSAGVPSLSGTMTNGQLIIGSTGATPTAGTITAGNGITVTNGAGSITIASTGGLAFVNQASNTATLAAFSRYLTNNGATLVTYTTPASCAVGDIYEIIGSSSGLWTIAVASGQSINFGDKTTTTTTGTLAATNQYDKITLMCSVANTTFVAYSSQGNITVT